MIDVHVLVRNIFCGAYTVSALQDPPDANRVIDYHGNRRAISSGTSKVVRVWDVQTRKVWGFFFASCVSNGIRYCVCVLHACLYVLMREYGVSRWGG